MTKFHFYDAAGSVNIFDTLEQAQAYAQNNGYVFVTSRSIVEGGNLRIYYYLSSEDVSGDTKDSGQLLSLLLSRYREWEEPRIMPVVTADLE